MLCLVLASLVGAELLSATYMTAQYCSTTLRVPAE